MSRHEREEAALLVLSTEIYRLWASGKDEICVSLSLLTEAIRAAKRQGRESCGCAGSVLRKMADEMTYPPATKPAAEEE